MTATLPPPAIETPIIQVYVECGWYRDYAPALWQGIKPMVICWRGGWIELPASLEDPGLVVDMYSIPWWVRWKWPRNRGQGNEAAYIHDATRRFWRLLGLSVLDSDRMFLDLMQALGIREARLFYAAVRLQGIVAPPPGDGTPPRDVRRAMQRRGDSWQEYAARVVEANALA